MRHAAAGVTEEQYPETMAMAGARAAAQVSVRARASARRTDADRAAGAAEPDRRGAAVVARPGHDPGKAGLVSEGAAQGLAQPADAAPPTSSRHFSNRVNATRPQRRDWPTRCAHSRARAWAMRCRPMSGTAPSCRRILRDQRAHRRRRRARSSRRAAIWPSCARSSAKPRNSVSPLPAPEFERTRHPDLGFRRPCPRR